ncbi:MAG: glycosyl hydrolase family 8 [Fibrobacterales bacterium]
MKKYSVMRARITKGVAIEGLSFLLVVSAIMGCSSDPTGLEDELGNGQSSNLSSYQMDSYESDTLLGPPLGGESSERYSSTNQSNNSFESGLSSSESEQNGSSTTGIESSNISTVESSVEEVSSSVAISSSEKVESIAYPIAQTIPDVRVEKDWTPILNKTWEGMKKRNVDPYPFGLLHRPKSETPGDAVSEGQGYGMIMALYSNDQEYFNKIYEAARIKMWNGVAFNWRLWQDGNVAGSNGATDADQDIALMLVFADHLVKKGVWQETPGKAYLQDAHEIIGSLRHNFLDGDVLKPGNEFGGPSALNPGYCTPAFYRIFAQTTGDNHWYAVANRCYDIIESNPGYAKGLLPDWTDAWGNTLPSGPGYNAYLNGQAMFKDAIRIYWRVANDAIWFGEERAINFLNNAMAFIKTKGDQGDVNYPADASDFFQMDGSLVPEGDRWEHQGFSRWRREHSHLTIGMWATAAYGTGDMVATEAFSRELTEFYEDGSDTWGKTVDDSGRDEDQAHNELYFDQFLAWYGAATINGNFCNILECVQ